MYLILADLSSYDIQGCPMPRKKIHLPPFTKLELKDQVWGVEFYVNDELNNIELNAILSDESYEGKKGNRPYVKAKWNLKKKTRKPGPVVEKKPGYDYGELARELVKLAAPLVGKKRSKQQKKSHLLGLTILRTVAEMYQDL